MKIKYSFILTLIMTVYSVASPGLEIRLDTLFFKTLDSIETKMVIFYSDNFNSKKAFDFVKKCFSGEIRFRVDGIYDSSLVQIINQKNKLYSIAPVKGGYLVDLKIKSPVSVNDFEGFNIEINICGAWDRARIFKDGDKFYCQTLSAYHIKKEIYLKTKSRK